MRKESSLQQDGQQDYMYEQHTIDSPVSITNRVMSRRLKVRTSWANCWRCAKSDLIAVRSLNAGEPCSEMERHVAFHWNG